MSEKPNPYPYHAFPNAGSNPDPAIDKVFWMVYVAGRGAPAVRHYELLEALAEAERLARKEPGLAVYLLTVVSWCVAARPDIRWEHCAKAPGQKESPAG